jgi:hypothetical protein
VGKGMGRRRKIMKIHELKCESNYFIEQKNKNKSFEIRKNDRDFKIGDYILLSEVSTGERKYTGRHLMLRITFILFTGGFPEGLKQDYVILSTKHMMEE